MFNSRKLTARYPDRPWVKTRVSQSLPAFLWDFFKTIFWAVVIVVLLVLVVLTTTGTLPVIPLP